MNRTVNVIVIIAIVCITMLTIGSVEGVAQTKKSGQMTAKRMIAIGEEYYYGRNDKQKNAEEAFRWYMKAANTGSAEGQYIVAVHYSNGDGVAKDDNAARDWYVKAANNGHTTAMYILGQGYEFGQKGCPKDNAQALQWYLKAAKRGHSGAQKEVGWRYLRGIGVPVDLPYSKYWYQKLQAQCINKVKELDELTNIRASATPTVRQATTGASSGGRNDYYDLVFDRYSPYVTRTDVGSAVSPGQNHSFVVRFDCSASDRISIKVLNRDDKSGSAKTVESYEITPSSSSLNTSLSHGDFTIQSYGTCFMFAVGYKSLGIGHASNNQVVYDKMFDISLIGGNNSNSAVDEQMTRLKNRLTNYNWKLKK